MAAVCLYFQVHQPFRLRRDFDFFAIGTDQPYEDEVKNRDILRKVAEKCYLPANEAMLSLIKRFEGRFRVAYSISGVALEQFELYEPKALESFRKLAATGAAEFLSETYYHSLASLFNESEFRRQVRAHQRKLKDLLGVVPTAFRNTELIYNDRIGELAAKMGFEAVLAEGADRVLGWRSPNFVYRPHGVSGTALLLKNYRLSDDVAFRFSNREWSGWPLTADKFAHWLHQTAGTGEVVNLFMDYETFGEHQWVDTGIFDFLAHLPEAILRHPDFRFMTPTEVARGIRSVAEIEVPNVTSWADQERDASAWLGNHMQEAAAEYVYSLEKLVHATHDEGLVHAWRKLQTSDHYYYMCTKHWADGDVHKYFSPYDSPYDAFIHHANAVNQLKWLCERRVGERKGIDQAESARAAARGLRRGKGKEKVRELRMASRR